MNKKEFYIYAYLDPRKPGNYEYQDLHFRYKPFYIGKGKNKRLFDHLDEKTITNPYKTNTINKIKKEGFDLKYYIIKLYENLNNDSANLLEIETIKKIRLKNLTNIDDGGQGGNLYKNLTLEQKRGYKDRAIIAGKKRRGKTYIEMYGKENLKKYLKLLKIPGKKEMVD